MLVSAVQQRESTICIHIFPPSWTSLPPSHPLGHPRAPSWAPCVIQPLPISYIYITICNVYMSMLLSKFSTPSPSLCIYMSILNVCVSISALQIGSSVRWIFLKPEVMHPTLRNRNISHFHWDLWRPPLKVFLIREIGQAPKCKPWVKSLLGQYVQIPATEKRSFLGLSFLYTGGKEKHAAGASKGVKSLD